MDEFDQRVVTEIGMWVMNGPEGGDEDPLSGLPATYADRCGITLAEALDTPWAEVRARLWQPPVSDTPSQPPGPSRATPTLLAAVEAKQNDATRD